DEQCPELWINNEVAGLYAAIKNLDARFTALIMPEALRQVLNRLLEDGEPWSDEGVRGKWLELAESLYGDKFEEWDDDDREGSREKRREWVNQVVGHFAATHRLFDRFHEQLLPAEVEDSTDD
ncbi:MAG TPA: hypothetical protein VGJ04_08310, partial [Pirellulales bacterium]